jgi:hypothetical protein
MKILPRLAMLAALATTAAHAADIYRWVDDEGRTHISDSVPDRYRARAQRYDSDAFKANDADMKASRERNERIRKESDAMERARTAPAPTGPIVIGTDAAAQGGTGGDVSAKDATPAGQCQASWDAYSASQACFQRFRNANATVRAEAFQSCGPAVAQPTCGPNYGR